jgi:hypothetical protein
MKIIYEIDKSGVWKLNVHIHVTTAVDMYNLSLKIDSNFEYQTEFDSWCEKMEEEKVFTNLTYQRFQGRESIIFIFSMRIEEPGKAIEEFQKYMQNEFWCYNVVSSVPISKLDSI